MTFQLDFLPIRTGIHPFVFFKLSVEIGQTVETALVSDLGDRTVRFGHDDARLTDPDRIDVFDKGHAKPLFKKVAQ